MKCTDFKTPFGQVVDLEILFCLNGGWDQTFQPSNPEQHLIKIGPNINVLHNGIFYAGYMLCKHMSFKIVYFMNDISFVNNAQMQSKSLSGLSVKNTQTHITMNQ